MPTSDENSSRSVMRVTPPQAGAARLLALVACAGILTCTVALGAAEFPGTRDRQSAQKTPATSQQLTVSEPKAFTDPLLQTLKLVSGVNGSEYELRIGLPYTYSQNTKTYPVFVVLDGETLFLTASEATRNEWASSSGPLSGGAGPIPEFIVVSIALPSMPPNAFRRNFEYMPRAERDDFAPSMRAFIDKAEATYGGKAVFGGASIFLKVLETEILPSVAKRYRVDTAQRMLFGHSAGGTFVAYALMTRPDLFTDYIIASPGLVPESFRLEEAWAAKHKDLRARVLLTAGEKEFHDPLTIASATARFAEALTSRKYPGLDLQTWIVPDANHGQTAIPSLVRGLARSSRP